MKKGSLAAWGASLGGLGGVALGTTGISSNGRRTTPISGSATPGGIAVEKFVRTPGALEPLRGGAKGAIRSPGLIGPGEVQFRLLGGLLHLSRKAGAPKDRSMRGGVGE